MIFYEQFTGGHLVRLAIGYGAPNYTALSCKYAFLYICRYIYIAINILLSMVMIGLWYCHHIYLNGGKID